MKCLASIDWLFRPQRHAVQHKGVLDQLTGPILIFGVPTDFILLALTLLGIALFQKPVTRMGEDRRLACLRRKPLMRKYFRRKFNSSARAMNC
jgi:hypothetical protein